MKSPKDTKKILPTPIGKNKEKPFFIYGFFEKNSLKKRKKNRKISSIFFKNQILMHRYLSSPWILGGAVLLGILLSLVPGIPLFWFEGFASFFLRVLKLISLPLVFFSILSSFSQMQNKKETQQLGKKVLKYTVLTTFLAAGLALFLFHLFAPAASSFSSTTPSSPIEGKSYFSFLQQSIPENWITPFLEGNVLAIALLAALLGIASLSIPKPQKEVLDTFIQGVFSLFLQIASFAVLLLPISIVCFIVIFTHQKIAIEKSSLLMSYLGCIILANLLQGLLVLPLLLKSKKISTWQLVKGAYPSLTTAFFTKSSNATLPLTLKCAEENLQMHTKVAKFSLPLCSIINMNGCAAFIMITVLFVARMSGLYFSWGEQLLWVGLSTLAAIGNAGIPMGCYFLAGAFLLDLNLPLDFLGYILPAYVFLDMLETALNVWSDFCVTKLVEKEWLLSEEKAEKIPSSKEESLLL